MLPLPTREGMVSDPRNLPWECFCGSQYTQVRDGSAEEQAKLARWMDDHDGCDVDGEPVSDEAEEHRLEYEYVTWADVEADVD